MARPKNVDALVAGLRLAVGLKQCGPAGGGAGCGVVRQVTEFTAGSQHSSGLYPYCRQCTAGKTRRHNRVIRVMVLEHYSGGEAHCACCNEKYLPFLTIDHIAGGGNAHRREVGNVRGGSVFYSWLRRTGYPEGFRVLCLNCNRAAWMEPDNTCRCPRGRSRLHIVKGNT